MKYLTKEWYRKSNLTDLHFDLAILDEAADQDDELFASLYKDEEEQFIQDEREEYDYDPRNLFAEDSFDQESDLLDFLAEEEFIEQLIESFDKRPAFSAEKTKELFAEIYQASLDAAKENLPPEIYSQIADPRVFALGFCSDEIYNLVRDFSISNNRESMQVLEDYEDMMRLQNIPRQLRQRFGFHDCKITGWLSQGKDLVLTLDTEDGFTSDNRITFLDVTVLLDENIVRLYWIYDELYKTENGYEVHILCDGDRTAELTLRCSDIRIEEI
ncbi:MAG: DUF4085 family protein [Clostridiaceae bacterium]|jgi:hypothetical protein|nr:DUF4085 family protein [Clostridiaceae bacterium]